MMFTTFILFLALAVIGLTLLLDTIPGNDRLGWGFLVTGVLGALVTGWFLWDAKLVVLAIKGGFR